MISIIMPSFNQVSFIERAIDSVFNHHNIDLELIISDGGSTDGTLELLEKKSEIFDTLSWSSQPDSGPAEALNRSLARSHGTIIGWLNSDDCYKPNILPGIADYFASNPEQVMIYGHGEYTDVNDKVISRYPTQTPDVGLEGFKSGCFICQPTVFFKRTLYGLQGPLDESYKASFDYEYWLRAFSKFPTRIGFMDKTLAQSRLHEDGITQRFRTTIAIEGARICKKYFGEAPIHWAVTFIEEMEDKNGTQFCDLSPLEQDAIFNHFTDYCNPNALAELRDTMM